MLSLKRTSGPFVETFVVKSRYNVSLDRGVIRYNVVSTTLQRARCNARCNESLVWETLGHGERREARLLLREGNEAGMD